MTSVVSRFLGRRRELAREFFRIERVDGEARQLVEDLRRRRDGLAPQALDLRNLRVAVGQVDASRYGGYGEQS